MNSRKLTLFILALLLPGILQAQTTSTDEVEEIRLYDVEIAIFKNVQAPKSKEYVLPVSSPGKDEKYLDISSASNAAELKEAGYELLPADGMRLLDVVARLVESPRYELLLHATWRQPGLDKEKVLPVWIKGGQIYGDEYTSIDSQIELLESIPSLDDTSSEAEQNFAFDEQSLEALELQLLEQQASYRHQGLYELEGKITIALSRYLHTYTDLVLRRPRLTVDPNLRNVAQDRYLATYAADTHILNNHHLKEHRRMRSKTLHYLDSPEFAMLILITPYEAPEIIEEVPIEVEPAVSE